MTHNLIVWCVIFCMHSAYLQSNASSIDKGRPYEQFFGLKLDAKRDLRVVSGDYAIATNAVKDKSMVRRADQLIALGGKEYSTGNAWGVNLSSKQVVTRGKFVLSLMPDIVVQKNDE